MPAKVKRYRVIVAGFLAANKQGELNLAPQDQLRPQKICQ